MNHNNYVMENQEILIELKESNKHLIEQIQALYKIVESSKLSKDNDKFLDINGVSELTGLAKQTIYDLKCKGKIPFISFGRLLRFQESEITKWMLTRNQLNS